VTQQKLPLIQFVVSHPFKDHPAEASANSFRGEPPFKDHPAEASANSFRGEPPFQVPPTRSFR